MICEAIFDTPFMIQIHAESMKKIVGALLDLPGSVLIWKKKARTKVFNWSELHFSEVTFHKIHILTSTANLAQFTQLCPDWLCYLFSC